MGWLQATFHLKALARPWRAAFCWLFHCSRRRGWVGRHVAWRSLTPPCLDLVDDGCGVAWCPLQPMLDFLCSRRLTCKGRPGSMPRGEQVKEMKHPARPALRGIHVVGTHYLARLTHSNNGSGLCTRRAALKSQEPEENLNMLTISRRFLINLSCHSRAFRRWLVVLALTLHVSMLRPIFRVLP